MSAFPVGERARSSSSSVVMWTVAAALVSTGGALAGCGSVGTSKDAGTGGGGGGAGGVTSDADGDHAAAGGGGGAGGSGGGDAAADSRDAARDGGACTLLASCAALHACDPTLLSGNYMIAPAGAPDAGGLLVHCDMETGGGGWTVIYLADGVNLNSTAIAYTVPAQALRDNAQEALIAFRNLNLNMVASDWASFGLPATWRAKNPLAVSPFEDLTVSASVNGALPALAQLRYGTSNFGSLCGDGWDTASLYGRVCLQGTAAAFYSGFTVGDGTADYCALSTASYSSRPCSDANRFSIAVR